MQALGATPSKIESRQSGFVPGFAEPLCAPNEPLGHLHP